jgi:hypothetical protein
MVLGVPLEHEWLVTKTSPATRRADLTLYFRLIRVMYSIRGRAFLYESLIRCLYYMPVQPFVANM